MAVCKKCNKVYEYLPETKHEGGMLHTSVKCPHCGNIKKDSISYVHYGEDSLNK